MLPLWTKSLRFQLTAWSLLTAALVLLPAAALCYGLVRASLLRDADQALALGAAQVARQMADPPEADERERPPDAAALVSRTRLAPVTLPGIGTGTLYLRLVSAGTRRTVSVSPDLTARADFLAALQALPPAAPGTAFAGAGDDDRMRCRTVSLPHSSDLLQTAIPWDPMEDLLGRLLAGLALACLLFLLLSGVGSWLLVGRALRPIDRIVTEAEALTPDRLGASAIQAGSLSDNEIGHLVTALNGMTARLGAAFARQRRFTADSSHELRTPLTILRGEFELALARERAAAEYRRTLESGLEEVGRMTRIVESLALLARGDAEPPLPQTPVALAALCAEVTQSLRRQAEGKGLSLVLDAADAVIVRGDADALRRMVRNLVENALTYTPPGGQVTVTVREGGAEAALCVADTGVGIAPEDLPHVFDRFFRGDKARANTGGSGLGLSIARSIAEAHGGQITAGSEPGAGSVFRVTLPSGD